MNLPIGITGRFRIIGQLFGGILLITFNLSSAYLNYIDNRLDNCKLSTPYVFYFLS